MPCTNAIGIVTGGRSVDEAGARHGWRSSAMRSMRCAIVQGGVRFLPCASREQIRDNGPEETTHVPDPEACTAPCSSIPSASRCASAPGSSTFREFADRVARLAGALQALGMQAGRPRRDALAQLRPLPRVPDGRALGRRRAQPLQHPLVGGRDPVLAGRLGLDHPAGRRDLPAAGRAVPREAQHACAR